LVASSPRPLNTFAALSAPCSAARELVDMSVGGGDVVDGVDVVDSGA